MLVHMVIDSRIIALDRLVADGTFDLAHAFP